MVWRVADGALLIGDWVELSFQRYPRPSAGTIAEAPSSCGALPVAIIGAGEALVPLAPDEAVWIGLMASAESFVVRINASCETTQGLLELTEGPDLGSQGVLVPPPQQLDGIPAPHGGFWPFASVEPAPDAPVTIALHIESSLSSRQRNGPARPQPPQPQHNVGSSGSQGEKPNPRYQIASGGQVERVRISFVAPTQFTAVTGVTFSPLDETSRYGEWRLP
jgi:hypothetical protein